MTALLNSAERTALSEHIERLNVLLDQACAAFRARFSFSAVITFAHDKKERTVAFRKNGEEWAFMCESYDPPSDILSCSLALRMAFAHQLPALWYACQQREADSYKDLARARSAAEEFLSNVRRESP